MKMSLIKTGLTLVTTALAYIPLWIILLAKLVFSPNGFWQKFALYGAGIYFLGSLQVIFFIIWIVILVAIWTDSY